MNKLNGSFLSLYLSLTQSDTHSDTNGSVNEIGLLSSTVAFSKDTGRSGGERQEESPTGEKSTSHVCLGDVGKRDSE